MKKSEVKFYFTNERRENAINEITKQIETVLTIPGDVLGYVDGRRIVDNLILLREAIKREMN